MTRISMTINGVEKQVEASPETVLFELLRDDLHLTGTKQIYRLEMPDLSNFTWR